jgi:hypothetical protein
MTFHESVEMSLRKTFVILGFTSLALVATACGKGPSDPTSMPGEMDMRVASPDSSAALR